MSLLSKKIFIFSLVFILLRSEIALGESQDFIDVNHVEASIALGYGTFDFPLVGAQTTQLNLLPQLTWYGEKAFFNNGLFGYSLSESDDYQVDFILYPNEDGIFFKLADDENPG